MGSGQYDLAELPGKEGVRRAGQGGVQGLRGYDQQHTEGRSGSVSGPARATGRCLIFETFHST